jgi:uncharacterized Fe-S cluster protein YjdI
LKVYNLSIYMIKVHVIGICQHAFACLKGHGDRLSEI